MICYRDMTFCPFYGKCRISHSCHRPLTPTVKQDAEQCGLPICRFAEKPECFIPIDMGEETAK